MKNSNSDIQNKRGKKELKIEEEGNNRRKKSNEAQTRWSKRENPKSHQSPFFTVSSFALQHIIFIVYFCMFTCVYIAHVGLYFGVYSENM